MQPVNDTLLIKVNTWRVLTIVSWYHKQTEHISIAALALLPHLGEP